MSQATYTVFHHSFSIPLMRGQNILETWSFRHPAFHKQRGKDIEHPVWFQTCISFSSSALFFRSSSSCFLFNSISALLKCRQRKMFSKAAFPSTSDDPPPPCLSLTVVCHLPLVCVAALQPPSSSFLSPSPPQFFSASLPLPPPAFSSAWRRVAALSASPALGTLCRSLSRLWSVRPRAGQ